MKANIKELLNTYKAKLIEEYIDSIVFNLKNTEVCIQIENEEEGQFWIKNVYDVDLPEEYYDHILEYGNIDDFESFLVAIKDGEYNYIKTLYNSLYKLQEKYEDEFQTMIQYFT